MRRVLASAVLAVLLCAGILAWLSRPLTVAVADLPGHTPDAAAGERWFWAGGCAGCHATPVDGKRARNEALFRLGGGLELETDFGLFRVPNISPHAGDGIGGWSAGDFVNAMQRGVSPAGEHYYPSFPYTSYARMPVADVLDLWAYLRTLPPVAGKVAGHSVRFPWSMRRGIGLWKRRYLDTDPVADVPADEAALAGRLLVEGAGHCGECHTSRDAFGGLRREEWLGGAPSPEGEGNVPDITPSGKDVGSWSAADIAYFLESGFTPDFDTVGGSMVAVQEHLARLPAADRQAIAAYLKAIPPARPDVAGE